MHGQKQINSISITLGKTGIGDDFPVRTMGVINLSAESFYKGSVCDSSSIPHIAAQMTGNSVSFLDIGGRSTAPQSAVITVLEEKKRVVNALDALFSSVDTGDTLISIDTQFREVADAAFKLMMRYHREGCFVLNDVSCLVTDPQLADWTADTIVPVILMAAHQRPGDSLGIGETISDLKRGISLLDGKGYPVDSRLIVDPGIGKWIPEKELAYDLELIARLREFRDLGMPILAGISRKSFIGSILLKKEPKERLQGTLAATAIAVYNGAHIIRTHDICRETEETIRTAEAIRKGIQGTNT